MARISPLIILPPVIFVAFVVMAVIGLWRDDPEALPSARQGQPAPPLQLAELGRKAMFTDETLRDGRVKLVNFWASWCAPCRVEHPNLTILQKEGMAIYGINYKDTVENGLGFLEELGDPYVAIGADPEGRTGLEWGVYGLPETFLIDGDGTVLLRLAGALTERELTERLRPALAKLN